MKFACVLVGWFLIVLGSCSGLVLLVQTGSDDGRRTSLWGLFLIGLLAGLALLHISENWQHYAPMLLH